MINTNKTGIQQQLKSKGHIVVFNNRQIAIKTAVTHLLQSAMQFIQGLQQNI